MNKSISKFEGICPSSCGDISPAITHFASKISGIFSGLFDKIWITSSKSTSIKNQDKPSWESIDDILDKPSSKFQRNPTVGCQVASIYLKCFCGEKFGDFLVQISQLWSQLSNPGTFCLGERYTYPPCSAKGRPLDKFLNFSKNQPKSPSPFSCLQTPSILTFGHTWEVRHRFSLNRFAFLWQDLNCHPVFQRWYSLLIQRIRWSLLYRLPLWSDSTNWPLIKCFNSANPEYLGDQRQPLRIPTTLPPSAEQLQRLAVLKLKLWLSPLGPSDTTTNFLCLARHLVCNSSETSWPSSCCKRSKHYNLCYTYHLQPVRFICISVIALGGLYLQLLLVDYHFDF